MTIEQVMVSTLEKFGIQTNFTPETLLADLGIDSLMMLELIIDFEEQFDFSFADNDLVRSNFETVESVIRLVEQCLEKKQ